jgi:bifunctional DNA-binding transcriptional regulator/antitoxin component of YhaV-PrlF toxin-antitoxin module
MENTVLTKFIFCPIHWVTSVDMAETTYYEDKVYLPKGVREKLGLVDGDVLHIEVVEKGVAKLSVVGGCRKAKLAREMLENPPNLGRIKGHLSREEIYEDIT